MRLPRREGAMSAQPVANGVLANMQSNGREAATVVALLAAESPRAVAITSSGNDGGE